MNPIRLVQLVMLTSAFAIAGLLPRVEWESLQETQPTIGVPLVIEPSPSPIPLERRVIRLLRVSTRWALLYLRDPVELWTQWIHQFRQWYPHADTR